MKHKVGNHKEALVDNLKELFKHPGWSEYVDVVEGEMVQAFMELFQLDPSKPESFIKFVELKSGIDKLRNVTYFYERQVAGTPDEVTMVDNSYGKRFITLLKKIFMGDKHGK
jgi:hypothetical protein